MGHGVSRTKLHLTSPHPRQTDIYAPSTQPLHNKQHQYSIRHYSIQSNVISCDTDTDPTNTTKPPLSSCTVILKRGQLYPLTMLLHNMHKKKVGIISSYSPPPRQPKWSRAITHQHGALLHATNRCYTPASTLCIQTDIPH